jgi:hypothetical protein
MNQRQMISFILMGALYAAPIFSAEDRYPVLEDVLAGYRQTTVNMSDLDVEAQQYLTANTKIKNPGFIIIDINEDGTQDVALLVKEKNTSKLHLNFFLCAQACEKHSSFDLGEFYGLQYLGPIKPRSLSTEDKLNTTNLAVLVTYYGKGSVMYYWDKSTQRIKSVGIAD